MASPLSTTASASAFSKPTLFHHANTRSLSLQSVCISFRLTPPPPLRFFPKNLQPHLNCSTAVKAQPNEEFFFEWFSIEDLFSNFRSFLDTLLGSSVAVKVPVEGSSNAAANHPKLEVPAPEEQDVKPSKDSSTLATEESIAKFFSQVTSLVKFYLASRLVDSKDIVELQLKQLDCELIILKKQALPQPPSPPLVMMHSPSPSVMTPSPPALSPLASTPTLSAAPSLAPSTSASKSDMSSIPPLKCPMAGTFYRSPAPGEPPFVKVGDKVQKGRVVCIIEAMKLMNEIEADQSGTIIDIIAEDGKPVSVDTPLFVIQP